MLLRHSAVYLLAKLVPAIVGLGSIAIYTRLLGAEQYGRFALVYSVAGVTYGLFYAWLWVSLARFVPLYQGREARLQSVVLRSFVALSLLGGLAGAVLALLWPDPATRSLVWLAIPLCWLMGWYEINLELDRARLRPAAYSLFSILKSLATVGASTALAYLSFGAHGMVWGAIIGMVLPLLLRRGVGWLTAYREPLQRESLVELGRYGLPLSASMVLSMLIFNADRLMLGGLLSAEMAGLYSVSYDLALKTMYTFILALDLAAFPLVVRALKEAGEPAARRQLLTNCTLLLSVTVPAATGLGVLAEPVIRLFLGAEYRETALVVFPWIVLASFLAGLSHAHFQHAFALGRRTGLMALLMAIAALANIKLNLVLIPVFGVAGAAYASVASFTLLMLLSWGFGRRAFPVPVPWRNGARIVLASALMAAVLLLLDPPRTALGLLVQIGLGGSIYAAALLVLNPDDYRSRLLALARRRLGRARLDERA